MCRRLAYEFRGLPFCGDGDFTETVVAASDDGPLDLKMHQRFREQRSKFRLADAEQLPLRTGGIR